MSNIYDHQGKQQSVKEYVEMINWIHNTNVAQNMGVLFVDICFSETLKSKWFAEATEDRKESLFESYRNLVDLLHIVGEEFKPQRACTA